MNLFKKIRNLHKDKFTFVIVPHSGGKTKQVNLNKLLLTSSIVLLTSASIFFISATFFLYDKNSLLNQNLQIKNDEINNLNIINSQQKYEIAELKNTSKLVIDKLSQLYALENQVRDMVGLKTKPEDESLKSISRSFDRINETGSGGDMFSDLSDLTNTDSVDTITGLINTEKDSYDKLIKDVEKQLKYLDSKPNKWPVNGKITSKFGYRIHPISKRRDFHKGIDIANDTGTKIVAAGSGVVTYSGWNGGYGKIIIISHGYGYKSVYAHNHKNLVEVGDRVKKGEAIAKLGNTGRSTGPHLHFEIHYNGDQINPVKILK